MKNTKLPARVDVTSSMLGMPVTHLVNNVRAVTGTLTMVNAYTNTAGIQCEYHPGAPGYVEVPLNQVVLGK